MFRMFPIAAILVFLLPCTAITAEKPLPGKEQKEQIVHCKTVPDIEEG